MYEKKIGTAMQLFAFNQMVSMEYTETGGYFKYFHSMIELIELNLHKAGSCLHIGELIFGLKYTCILKNSSI